MRFKLSWCIVFVALGNLATPGSAQSPKPAWRWTLDERLAVINDPLAAAERLRVERGRRVSTLAKTAPTANFTPSDLGDFISGRDHPELLLPWQLFDNMMTMAFADDPEVRSDFREEMRPALASSGLPPDFWNRLESLSLAYLSDDRQLRDLHKRRVRDASVQRRIALQSHALENLKCRDRAAAIAAARHDLGEKFDQFLYVGIAPNMSSAVTHLGHITAAREHEIEGGCR